MENPSELQLNQRKVFNEQYGIEFRKAATSANSETIKNLLIEHGDEIDINGTSTNGNTALDWAVAACSPQHLYHNKNGDYQSTIFMLLAVGVSLKTTRLENLLAKSALINYLKFAKLNINFSHEKDFSRRYQIYSAFALMDNYLLNVFANLKIKEKFKGLKKIKIVSLLYGTCLELPALMNYFNKHNIEWEYTAIFMDKDVAKDAQEKFKNFKNVTIKAANLSSVNEINQLQLANSADFILFRNPDMIHKPDTCKYIILEIIPRLSKENSFVYMSFYSPEVMNTLNSIPLKEFYEFLPQSSFSSNDTPKIGFKEGKEVLPFTPDNNGVIFRLKKILTPELVVEEEEQIEHTL